jgi:hypothetical protein
MFADQSTLFGGVLGAGICGLVMFSAVGFPGVLCCRRSNCLYQTFLSGRAPAYWRVPSQGMSCGFLAL